LVLLAGFLGELFASLRRSIQGSPPAVFRRNYYENHSRDRFLILFRKPRNGGVGLAQQLSHIAAPALLVILVYLFDAAVVTWSRVSRA
jgi:hypothetical protein